MNKNVNYLLSLSAALMLAGLTACGPSGDKSATTAAGDTSTDSTMTGSMTSGTAQISVTNPMPHEMTVSADMGQGSKQLGAVQPNETKTFDVEAAAGTTINLVATDAGNSHSPKGSVTVEAGQPATWTIQ
ncbi:MAG: hypothetical protein ABIR48_04165 [Gammaproteobacteria bacterium]